MQSFYYRKFLIPLVRELNPLTELVCTKALLFPCTACYTSDVIVVQQKLLNKMVTY